MPLLHRLLVQRVPLHVVPEGKIALTARERAAKTGKSFFSPAHRLVRSTIACALADRPPLWRTELGVTQSSSPREFICGASVPSQDRMV